MSNSLEVLDSFGLTFRAINTGDIDQWFDLIRRIAAVEKPAWHDQRDDLENALSSSKNNPAFDTLIGFDEQNIARAYAQVTKNPDSEKSYLFGGVDPQWQRRGIGRALLEWQQGRALERFTQASQAPGMVRVFADEHALAVNALYRSAGFQVVRYFSEMHRALSEEIPQLELDSGVRIESYTPELSEQIRQAHNEAFADHWGSEPRDQEAWGFLVNHEQFRADWSTVAIDNVSGEVAGYQIANYDHDVFENSGRKEGYTELLGVRRAYRGRGIAPALLADAMQRFIASGMDLASLDVDTENPSGALGLYQRMGYQAVHQSMAYDKAL
ncbi:mycothiol synthase [Psychromicrobium silvestre]|uniref:Mycothiol synthase n=1 Tax=Psychromicrobium silvestre TaxID=1645614 RepID=A0A7Y9S5H8_9MICC|nr:GNAT family N-acetyltransferase [Psychromicrobium silvestre]NYE94041.1 mycothiol synthase [Psychromicrobium silvestre]